MSEHLNRLYAKKLNHQQKGSNCKQERFPRFTRSVRKLSVSLLSFRDPVLESRVKSENPAADNDQKSELFRARALHVGSEELLYSP